MPLCSASFKPLSLKIPELQVVLATWTESYQMSLTGRSLCHLDGKRLYVLKPFRPCLGACVTCTNQESVRLLQQQGYYTPAESNFCILCIMAFGWLLTTFFPKCIWKGVHQNCKSRKVLHSKCSGKTSQRSLQQLAAEIIKDFFNSLFSYCLNYFLAKNWRLNPGLAHARQVLCLWTIAPTLTKW